MATDNTIHYMRITLAYDQTKISSKFKTLNKSFPRLRFHLLQLTFLVSNWPKMRRVKKKTKKNRLFAITICRTIVLTCIVHISMK